MSVAVNVFREYFKKSKNLDEKGKKQKYYTKKNFSWDIMKDTINELLKDNIPQFAKEVQLNLPTLNLPKL